MRKVLKNKKVIMMLIVVLSLLGINQIISADNDPGKITLTKTATKISNNFEDNNPEYGRLANVTLKVEANPYTEQETTMDKLDIILVLDSSGSMKDPAGSKSRLQALKDTANDFIKTMIGDDNQVQIGIVDYASSVKNTQALTSNKTRLENFVKNLKADGGTNTQSGIIKADELLDNSRSDARKLVIVLTDGVPTFFDYKSNKWPTNWPTVQCGNGEKDEASNRDYFYRRYECPNTKPSDAAKEAMDTLKNNHNTTDVYTITFGNADGAAEKMAKINPASKEGTKPVYKNVTALTGEDLEKEFKSIVDATRSLIGRNSEVIDIIPKEFKLTTTAKKELEDKGVKVVENEDGTTTIYWTLGDIEAGTDKAHTLSFDVEARDEYHGSMYTNQTEDYESATLNTTLIEGNPYYKNEKDENKELKFEAPVVNIPAITNDDHYTENESYVGYSKTTINGTTILNNDLNKIINNDKDKAETSITVKDTIIIEENKNTIKLSDNQYQLKDNDGKVLGTLIMHEDGTFNFTSEENITGEVSFNYHIKTTVTKDGKEEYVYSNSSTVTLNILEREKIEVTGTKTWNDGNNQDGIRPNNITVKLLANGEVIDTKVVNANTNWTYSFNNLYKYEAGHEKEADYIIKYTIEEVNVKGYETKIDGANITNTHTPEVIELAGTKTWNDNSNQDGIRPESITVNLFADGEKITSQEVTKNNDWKYVFSNLPKYKDGKVITYTITEDKVEGYTTKIADYNITNTHTAETTSVTGTKTWNDNNNQDGKRPESIIVNLYANGRRVDSKTVTEKENWTYTFDNLAKYSNGEEIKYTVTENEVEYYTTEVTGHNITNTHTPETTSVTGTKTWNDNNNQDGIRPDSITVNLFANGEKITSQEVTKNNDWKYVFSNLPKYKDGKVIEYTITETVINGYTAEITGYNITNTHTPDLYNEDGKYTVTKVWNDNNDQDGIRNSYTVTLTGSVDEIEVYKDTQTLTKDKTSYTWNNLSKYHDGKVIVYTVDETKVPDGYEKSVTGNTITNTHTPDLYNEDGKYTVTKVWNDNNNQDGIRDEFTVTLTGSVDEIEVYKDTQILTKDKTSYTWENLPKYKDGKVIEYTVDETEVPTGYTKKVDGKVITNTHTPQTIDLIGTKTWNDNNNQDGIRPETITVNLFADGEKITSQEVTKNNNWKYVFNNLPKYQNGQEIRYTITEDAVEGYETTINGLDITNNHKSETIKVSGTKTWNDNNNQDGIRPASITVNLLANGTIIDSKVVTEKENWTYTFANLDKYSNGEEIKYTVKEENVDNYTSKIEGYNITNTHTPETIDLTGTKTWNDNNNQDGIRPASITVRLLANGKAIDSKIVTAKTNWTYIFNDLAKYENGKIIKYTVTEDAVDGYSTEIDGLNITNTHKPIKIDITGMKVWVDENNIEGLRPNKITVRLLANGKEVSSTVVTADNNWTYTFTNLDKFADGQEINYTVAEDAVEHYDMSLDKDNKFVIINTHNPKNVEVTGTKTWIDEDNRYDRPETITVKLTGKVGDKVVVEETKDVTSEDNWNYSFTNLPEYREGMLITYTIDEEDVKDYTKSINGFNITNTYTPETIYISGTKTWNDSDNQDGIRPDDITINLLANGEVVATTTSTVETNWNFEFKDQVKFANGQEINYTVEEVAVDGYITSIEGFNVTNNHTPATVSYTVTKVWNDNNNNDNIRPENITVRLIADGIEVATQVIDEANNWTYSFTDLPKYRDGGIEIKYEIIEDEVKGYEASYTPSVSENDPNQNNITITNTHENEKNEITINKIWDDLDNPSRPNSIKVIIYADGKVIRTIELTKDMNWTYTINDLDKYKDGKLINYTIEELPVEGYTTTYNGFDIINSMIYGKGGDVEELPPQTGISVASTLPTNSNNLIILSLIALFMVLTSVRRIEEN